MNTGIKGFVVDKLLDGRAVGDHENLLLSGLVDSLGVMRLVRFIEGDLSLKVPPADITLDNFMTLTRIDAYVARLQETA